jgi:hypothetical protein
MEKQLKIYACNHFNGVWINGVAVIVAGSEEEALRLLKERLSERLLYQEVMDKLEVFEIPSDIKDAHILFDGDY